MPRRLAYLGHCETERQGHRVLAVGAPDLRRLGLVDREAAELELDAGQEGKQDPGRRLPQREGLGRIEYVHARRAEVDEARDVGSYFALQDVDEGADIVPRLLLLRVDLGGVDGLGRRLYRREELRIGATAEL